ncbi:NLE domain protein [Dictyocaulus viviparus]|uniref:NLE domain protein n=1 Tax=Dictyocaulus viviparus TaxID=29172 RepID=A0A0D8Y2H8_DICVI|nr:NLE domain protein [Dictyocaulus viviparus]
MDDNAVGQISVRFIGENGDELGGTGILLPTSVTCSQLQILCNQLLGSSEDPVPISFFTENGVEIVDSIEKNINNIDFEKTLCLLYHPQAVFRVEPVTRCSSSMPGHTEPVISAQFSPDGRGLSSGSGDATVRIWDIDTELPLYTCEGHKNWVLCISWSFDAKKVASACKNGQIMIWDADTGSQIGKTLIKHKQWITQLAWEPLHKDPSCRYLASAGKDGNIHIWDTIQGYVVRSLNGHTASVTCIRWGGEGLIYSGSQDRTVKVWRAKDGIICRNLVGHAHWINTLALNTDYVLRTSCFDPSVGCDRPAKEQYQEIAHRRYEDTLRICGGERGHVNAVYQVSWSADSRLLVSGSADSTLKVWEVRNRRLYFDLPGHGDEVYTVDWSPEGTKLFILSAYHTIHLPKLLFDLVSGSRSVTCAKRGKME